MQRLIFLFGAGASYGAGGILPEAPPLGTALYDALANSYPRSWGGLPPEVRQSFRTDGFEQGMKIVYDSYGSAIPQLMREMAVYFIQFRPYMQRTLYCRLVHDLELLHLLQTTTFSTLNYECVLEFSLLQSGHQISYFPDYDHSDSVSVWKLHGSCNMFAHHVQAGQSVFYGTGVTWEGGAQAFFDSNRVIEHCLVETGLAPMMSLYMEGKPLSVSPSVIKMIQAAWTDAVNSADAVIIIGVRPIIHDNHVWEPVAKTAAKIYFIGDYDSFADWEARERLGKPSEFLGSRFSNAYVGLIERVSHL